MTDRETAGLRGAVQRVLTESFLVDWQTKVMPDEPRVREETVYRADGGLQEQSGHYATGESSKSVSLFNESGRLEESRSSSARDSHVVRWEYDAQDRLIRVLVHREGEGEWEHETYQYAEDGTKTKVYFLPPESRQPGVAWGVGMEGPEMGSVMIGAASSTTIYDRRGLPTGQLMHGDRHELLAKVTYVWDERGLLTEGRLEPGDEIPSVFGAAMSLEERGLVAKALAAYILQLRVTYQYDEAGRCIEVKRERGQTDCDLRRTRYDDLGNPVWEQREPVKRNMSFGRGGEPVPESVEANEPRYTNRWEYTYDAQGNWTERVQWGRSDAEDQESVTEVMKRVMEYF